MFLGVILSLLLAIGGVVLAEQFDDSFHLIEDLRAFTAIPVLARIPHIVTKREIWLARLQTGLATIAALGCLALVITGSYYLAHDNDGLALLLMRSHS
jgi:hypothetical protein